jgi:hypothetical protein
MHGLRYKAVFSSLLIRDLLPVCRGEPGGGHLIKRSILTLGVLVALAAPVIAGEYYGVHGEDAIATLWAYP